MLSAAMAAILAMSAVYTAAQADTDIATDVKAAQDTATVGNITIKPAGQIDLKAAVAAVTINSSNSLVNLGNISNTGTSSATGILINTSGGNLVTAGGVYNVGGLGLTGDGTGKAALAVFGGNTFFGPITFSEVTAASLVSGAATTSTVQSSSIAVQGDQSYLFYFAQGTTIDGNVGFGGASQLVTSKNSTAAGATAMEIDGNLQGNLVFDTTSNVTNFANQARGVVILGPISPCVNNASLGYTCAASSTAVVGGTTLGNVGAFVNGGSITVLGTTNPSTKAKDVNPESGSAVIIANSIAGGFLNNGPATASSSIVTASISGNGATLSGVAFPTVLIDPSQSITTTNATIRGPVILGAVPLSIDPVDGASAINAGYGFINRGQIRATPESQDVSTTALIINGSSSVNNTFIQGGLLNTGTISSGAATSVNTNSYTSVNTVTIGSYVKIPRIVVSGEATSAVTFTPGAIAASVSGLGGGSATALGILSNSSVPEIDVLQHGSISATINTSTLAPTADFASTKTPFSQSSIAIVDASGTVKTVNNAGNIVAQVTQLNPGAGAVISYSTRAIDLLSGTTGAATINNSGAVQGDIYFNSGGGGNILNVGNTGAGTGDGTGNANAAVTRAQGAAVTNTPFIYATVSGVVLSTSTGFAPATDPNLLSFGSGVNNVLHVGGFGYVNSVISSAPGGLDIQVDNNGQLYIANTQVSGSVNARNLNIGGGILGLTISQNSYSTTPVVLASGSATLAATSQIGLQFGSFVSSGTTAASTTAPTRQVITLISATGGVTDLGLANQNTNLSQAIPFLFESPTESAAVPTPLTVTANSLTLTLLPRSTGKTNADGTAGLNLSGAARKLFPNTAAALGNDPELGTQVASSLTVYNNANGVSSGINIAASQAKAQQIFSEFAPDVSGGARQVAILITDQATGPVAARQRLLRSYGDGTGEMTLWGEEFAGMINNKGRFDGEGDLTTFKDHGFGFSLGVDAGSSRSGWYGGALTFYSGDVIETLPRQSKTNLQWYMLTGYTDWHGKHVFFDTKLDVGYGNLDGQRSLSIGNVNRIAEGKRASLLGALGGTTGLFLNYAGIDLTPHISLDALTMREEGYTEAGGGDGLNLQVAPYYASSLRTALGVDAKKNFVLFGANVAPEVRLGYRYDLVTSSVKLKAAFASTGGINAPNNSFTFVGPDPDTSNFVGGFSLGTGTDAWNLGVNYDWIRGNNASTTQVGTITLLGRI